MAKEILFTDLDRCFGPSSRISAQGRKDKWRTVAYRTGNIQGTMLSSLMEGTPDDLTFDPQLTGWYKIYVCIPTFPELEVQLKLTGDKGFFEFAPLKTQGLTFTSLEESFWRYAKMDGQSITLSKAAISQLHPITSILAWLRFVEMTEAEVDALMAERTRQDTKRLYFTDDIHNKLAEGNPDTPNFWEGVVTPYEDSDVEWLSLERITSFISGQCPDDDAENFAFPRSCDRNVQQQRSKFDSKEILGRLVALGHEMGMKMSLSLRMGAWGIGFPFDQCYFDFPDYLEHPQYNCIMRDGVPAAAWSYAYEPVQQQVISMLLEMAASGCDAVTLIAHRGLPYVLYEQPVVDRFRALYGEDPYDLPLDEPRLNALHCQIMNEFFRKLRKALDEAHPHRHVQIHLRSLISVYDNKYVGLDTEALAKEGLLDAIIVYPRRYREVYGPGCILPNGRVDMQAYKAWVNNSDTQPYFLKSDVAQTEDTRGVLQGPANVEDMVRQWMALEEQFGVKIYIDIMPRVMPPEDIRKRALELYDAGAKRIALWDTYGRVPCKAMWGTARKLGHIHELRQGFDPQTKLYHLQELAGNNISRYLPIWGG